MSFSAACKAELSVRLTARLKSGRSPIQLAARLKPYPSRSCRSGTNKSRQLLADGSKLLSCARRPGQRPAPHELILVERLESRGLRGRVPTVQGDAHAALCVETRSRGPVDVVGTDDASASADQGVGDAAVLITVTADGQHGSGVQDEDGHAGSSTSLNWHHGSGYETRVGGLRDSLASPVLSCPVRDRSI